MTLEEGALVRIRSTFLWHCAELAILQVEPLSVGLNAVSSVAELRPTSNVIVFGAGPVGLLQVGIYVLSGFATDHYHLGVWHAPRHLEPGG